MGQGGGTASLTGSGRGYCLFEWTREGVLPLCIDQGGGTASL